MSPSVPAIRNGQRIALTEVPRFGADVFAGSLAELLGQGLRVCAYFGYRGAQGDVELYAVCADDRNGLFRVFSGVTAGGRFPSLTPRFPQVHLFEREIWEQTGAVPDGHPWLKPVRFIGTGGVSPAIGEAEFFRMHGEEVHQVAVGPVHAGIIEPGHFRFQCHGETVHHLEISLGYQHRGIEERLCGGPHPVTPYQIEAVAGDSTIGHMLAYCQCIESLASYAATPYAELVRAVALELERCANHTGDLGALAGDVGFLPTMSYCGRIRGDFLNQTALVCGNRFGRGLVVPGGTGYDIDERRASTLAESLRRISADFLSATGLLWNNSSVMDRFESTGALSEKMAVDCGLVGPAARACGCIRDVRQDHPYGFYRFAHIPAVTHESGDVFARAHVRWREVRSSVEFLLRLLVEDNGGLAVSPACPDYPIQMNLKRDTLTVSAVEGWRGEICHVAITDAEGRFKRYKIVDPSFHNWFGLAYALRGGQISDFPLCNKSFNLSYCGFDL